MFLTPGEGRSLPPSDPPSKRPEPLRAPQVDFMIGCRCATCDLAVGLREGYVGIWRRWWDRVRREGLSGARPIYDTDWVCWWQRLALMRANGCGSVSALVARRDAEGVQDPSRPGDSTQCELPPVGEESN